MDILTDINDIYKNKFFPNREKLFLLYRVLLEYVTSISPVDRINFTEYALFNYIFTTKGVPASISSALLKARKYIRFLKKRPQIIPTDENIDKFYKTIEQFVCFINGDNTEQYSNILTANTIIDSELENDSETTPQQEIISSIKLYLLKKSTLIDCNYLHCIDDNDVFYIIVVGESKIDFITPL